MEEILYRLKDLVLARDQEWKDTKNPEHTTSIFVLNCRIQKLNETL